MESLSVTKLLQIRFCGFGGQGIVLMGTILGEAAAMDGFWVAGSNSYGAQARGTLCRSEVILSKYPIDFPHVLDADLVVAMSQEAYERFLPHVKNKGLIIYDDMHINSLNENAAFHVPIPATRKAIDELETPRTANIILLSAMVYLTKVVYQKAIKKAMKKKIPSNLRNINTKAMKIGFTIGKNVQENISDISCAMGILPRAR